MRVFFNVKQHLQTTHREKKHEFSLCPGGWLAPARSLHLEAASSFLHTSSLFYALPRLPRPTLPSHLLYRRLIHRLPHSPDTSGRRGRCGPTIFLVATLHPDTALQPLRDPTVPAFRAQSLSSSLCAGCHPPPRAAHPALRSPHLCPPPGRFFPFLFFSLPAPHQL